MLGFHCFSSSEHTDYRFGFNGMEKDDEVKGNGNSIFYKERVHDPRIGRFLSVDPIGTEFPWNSPYAFAENDVIRSVDLDGLEKINYTTKSKELWNTFLKVLSKDDVLKKTLYNTITKPELRDKVVVYFLTNPNMTSNGRTYDNKALVGRALALENFDKLPKNSYLRNVDTYTEDIERTREFFTTAGLDYKLVMKRYREGIKQHAVVANPNQGEDDQILTQAHEIELHLINDLNGVDKPAGQEHIEGFGQEYYDQTGTDTDSSPPHDETPDDSKMGKTFKRVRSAYKKVSGK